jgi:lipoate-protein ligase A
MKWLDLTLAGAPANLACDESLLEECEGNPQAEVLRFWEPREYFVVLGYANRAEAEVNMAACQKANLEVYRRCSGGGTVLQGPGCLNYSLALNLAKHPALESIPAANRHIMTRHCQALAGVLGPAVRVEGVTDLSLNGLKFSGNAQRRTREAMLFHGTFLLSFEIPLMEKFLPMPSRQPDYRAGRAHGQFVTNLAVPAERIKQALREEWGATEFCRTPPVIPPRLLHKYAGQEWNGKF